MEGWHDKNVNRHHTQYCGKDFKKSHILNTLRNHEGLIIPMNLFDHRDLHHELPATPRPTRDQAEELLDQMGRYDDMAERTDYMDIAINLMDEDNPPYADHLRAQRAIILRHPFTQIERDIVAEEGIRKGVYYG